MALECEPWRGSSHGSSIFHGGFKVQWHTLSVVHLLGAGRDLSRQAAAIQISQSAGNHITPEQSDILKQWNARVESHRPTPAKTQKHFKEATAGYLQQVASSSEAFFDAFTHHLDFVMDSLSAML